MDYNLLGYGDDYEGDAVNLMKYFTASAYSGFEDDEKVCENNCSHYLCLFFTQDIVLKW